MNRERIYPIVQALLAAVLFGASAPVAKLLLGKIEPVPLSAFLYLGSGISLAVFRGLQRMGGQSTRGEAPLSTADVPWLTGAVLAGGVAAPLVLMLSLRHVPAATASLLLNFEGVATTLLAAFVFREAIGRRVWWAIGWITAAGILLSWDPNSEWGISLGVVGVVAACALWGIDNNLTRHIAAKDPVAIVTCKGLVAGSFSLILALLIHSPFPGPGPALEAMLLGSLSYGASIILFILALRSLGAARASALFGSAPFVGTLLSFLLFRAAPDLSFSLAFPLMVVGAILLLSEGHEHDHIHTFMEHEHRHRHDDGHHAHDHTEREFSPFSSHSHLHQHEFIVHSHPHTPDLHHRHQH